ncbi:hypothetical protein GQ457_09G010100 [Hibiscus cannabinus]
MSPKISKKRRRKVKGQSSRAIPSQIQNSNLLSLCFEENEKLDNFRQIFETKNIRAERTIDLNFLTSLDYCFDFFEMFVEWGWMQFLDIKPRVFHNLVKKFYANASLIYSIYHPTKVISINSYLMREHIELTPERIAILLGVSFSGVSDESESVPLKFPHDSPTHLPINDRILHLFVTWFFSPSGRRTTRMLRIDYWWLYQFSTGNRPNIALIIFKSLVKIIKSPSCSLNYGCVLSHIFEKLNIDTSLDPAILCKSKIDMTTTKKTGWRFIGGDWVHKNDEDEARVIPRHVDAPVPN